LQVRQDFQRVINRTVRFFLNQPLEGVWEFEAAVAAVEEEAVVVMQQDRQVRIALSRIVRARQVV
jgi:ribosome maturation factor RimP